MEVSISRIQQIITFDATGRPRDEMQITFNVGPHGPFTVRIPKEEFSQARVVQEIEKVRREVESIVG
jgi:hypothetical protein